jgi:hypothetical protein
MSKRCLSIDRLYYRNLTVISGEPASSFSALKHTNTHSSWSSLAHTHELRDAAELLTIIFGGCRKKKRHQQNRPQKDHSPTEQMFHKKTSYGNLGKRISDLSGKSDLYVWIEGLGRSSRSTNVSSPRSLLTIKSGAI